MNNLVDKLKHYIDNRIMTDMEQIESVIQLYIDSMYESNPEKVKTAFHENGKVVGYLHGDFMQMSVDDFAGFVASQQPTPQEKGEDVEFETLLCEIIGATALVKVRDKYLGITFVDILSFIKVDEEWKIYNKLFHVESEK